MGLKGQWETFYLWELCYDDFGKGDGGFEEHLCLDTYLGIRVIDMMLFMFRLMAQLFGRAQRSILIRKVSMLIYRCAILCENG